MVPHNYSKQGLELIEQYKKLHSSKPSFNNVEIKFFRHDIKRLCDAYNVKTLLDYGSGGNDYNVISPKSDGKTFKELFGLEDVRLYEPGKGIDQRIESDAVICCDVLEHLHISDVVGVIREICSLAKKLVMINVGCYHAVTILPNGVNAHTTVRPVEWWLGLVEAISYEFPHLAIQLWASRDHGEIVDFGIVGSPKWENSELKTNVVAKVTVFK